MNDQTFRKSSYSHAECVEVKPLDDTVVVRDSKNPEGPTQTFTRQEWVAFLAGVKDGEFDFDWMDAEQQELIPAGM